MELICPKCKKGKLIDDSIEKFPSSIAMLGNLFFMVGILTFFLSIGLYVMIEGKKQNDVADNPMYEEVGEGFTYVEYRKKNETEISRDFLKSKNIPANIIDEVINSRKISPASKEHLKKEQLEIVEKVLQNLKLFDSPQTSSSRSFSWSEFFWRHWMPVLIIFAVSTAAIGSYFGKKSPIKKCFSCGYVKKLLENG
ncbi:MAG: hypothetical protein AB1403_06090 [Candidatus Riflebacteria bacterium]